MKTITRSLIGSLILLVLNFSYSVAQTAPASTPDERAAKWDSWMKENITLTAEQEAPVHAINLKFALQSEGLKTGTDSRVAKLQALKEIDKKKDADLKPLLTADQFKTYQAKKKDFQRELLGRMKQ